MIDAEHRNVRNVCIRMSYQFLKVLESRLRDMNESLLLCRGDVGYEMYMRERKRKLDSRMEEIANECGIEM